MPPPAPPAGTATPSPAPPPPSAPARPAPNLARSDGTQVAVPELRGRTTGDAVATLLALGLSPSVSADRDPRAVAGQVRTQSPAPNAQARTGSVVAVTVGGGYAPTMAEVPSVVGVPSRDAVARLQALGYSADVVRARGRPGVYSVSDLVVAQWPTGRAARAQANPVTLWVIGP